MKIKMLLRIKGKIEMSHFLQLAFLFGLLNWKKLNFYLLLLLLVLLVFYYYYFTLPDNFLTDFL